MTLTIVTFTNNWRGYAAGETAGFDETTATGLIDGEYAEAAKKGGKRAPKPADPKTPASGKEPEKKTDPSGPGDQNKPAGAEQDDEKP